mgnify:CR=1 FL=1
MFTHSLPLLLTVYSPHLLRKLWKTKSEGCGEMDEEPWCRVPGLAAVFAVNLAVILLFQFFLK